MYKLCFIDTETTGVNAKENGIIQIAGEIVLLEGLTTGTNGKHNAEVVDSFNLRAKPFPRDVVDPKALEVNKVSLDEITQFQEPILAYKTLSSLFAKHCDKYDKADKFFFVGYNARFDYDFMRAWWEKNGDNYFGSFFFFPPLDVMNIAIWNLIRERKTLPNFKLETVANHLDLTVEGDFHDAMKDILITKEIFLKYLREGNG